VKIRSKLLLLNLAVHLSAMVLLGFLVTLTASNFIEDSLSNELRIQHRLDVGTLEKMLAYGKRFEEYLEKGQYQEEKGWISELTVMTLVVEWAEKKILIAPEILEGRLAQEELSMIFHQNTGDLYTISLFGRSFLAANTLIEAQNTSGKSSRLLVCSFVSRHQIFAIRNRIVLQLILLVGLITILLIVLTNYSAKIIVKPINVLIKATEKIGRKQFDQAIELETGDEFEYLGSAINSMATSLQARDIAQKNSTKTSRTISRPH